MTTTAAPTMSLDFERLEDADAPTEAWEWVSNIALFGIALVAIAT